MSYFRRRCASAEEIEDLAQDVYCAILEGYPRLRNVDAPAARIMTICRNVFANHARRQVRARSVLLPYGDEERGATDELIRSLLIESLSPRERKLYSLKYVELRSIKEISAELSQPEGTVKYHLYKLR